MFDLVFLFCERLAKHFDVLIESAVDQRELVGMAAAASQSLDHLMRRHGIKIIPAERCSIEECTIAVAEIVGYASILSAARMNSAIVFFLNNVEKLMVL